MALNLNLLRRYADLNRQLTEFNDRAKAVKNEMDGLTETIIQHMADEQVEKVNLAPGVNLKITSLTFAKYPDPQSAMAALRKAGFDDMIHENFDRGRLNALIREFEDAGDPLPEAFVGVIEANPKYYVRINKS
jgi:hypothetical protein